MDVRFVNFKIPAIQLHRKVLACLFDGLSAQQRLQIQYRKRQRGQKLVFFSTGFWAAPSFITTLNKSTKKCLRSLQQFRSQWWWGIQVIYPLCPLEVKICSLVWSKYLVTRAEWKPAFFTDAISVAWSYILTHIVLCHGDIGVPAVSSRMT